QRPDHGEIVCHCELVTRREIEATFDSPVPPGDFGGLRRRTRAGMGRCQGFYCNARLAEMTRGKLKTPLASETGESR
ncbi:MAG: (2Fe-2S)-binding protein, partial [Proteobacteria bacterium]|nr:(2Fe-2S)-binding protein [Pseudomonadota bacterium]